MKRKIEVTREPKVHIFGDPGTCCICEEIVLNIEEINPHTLNENINIVLNHFKDNRVFYLKLTTSMAISLFIASNPTVVFTQSLLETVSKLGDDAMGGVILVVTKGILIMTALRLFSEFAKGGNKYNTIQILKETVLAILVTNLLPRLPTLIELFLNTYLSMIP